LEQELEKRLGGGLRPKEEQADHLWGWRFVRQAGCTRPGSIKQSGERHKEVLWRYASQKNLSERNISILLEGPILPINRRFGGLEQTI
jgi:hypothetical protein